MKTPTTIKITSGLLLLLFPLLFSCSIFSGGSMSGDPVVRAQQERVQALENELKVAERQAEEAKERERAAKNRLKAAEHELKALESQAKRNGN